jgi:hypothetical protein
MSKRSSDNPILDVGQQFQTASRFQGLGLNEARPFQPTYNGQVWRRGATMQRSYGILPNVLFLTVLQDLEKQRGRKGKMDQSR